MIEWTKGFSGHEEVATFDGRLRGVLLAYASGAATGEPGFLVECDFPSRTKSREVQTLAEATVFVYSQLAWLVWRCGIVNGPVGDCEPLACVVTGWNRYRGLNSPAQQWRVQTGLWNAHDNSFLPDQQHVGAVVLRNQKLLLRAPKDWTGLGDRDWEREPAVYE